MTADKKSALGCCFSCASDSRIKETLEGLAGAFPCLKRLTTSDWKSCKTGAACTDMEGVRAWQGKADSGAVAWHFLLTCPGLKLNVARVPTTSANCFQSYSAACCSACSNN